MSAKPAFTLHRRADNQSSGSGPNGNNGGGRVGVLRGRTLQVDHPSSPLTKLRSMSATTVVESSKTPNASFNKMPGSPAVTLDGTTLIAQTPRRSNSLSRTLKAAIKTDERFKGLPAPLTSRFSCVPNSASKVGFVLRTHDSNIMKENLLADPVAIGTKNLATQEVFILEDLLFVLQGIEGVHIRVKQEDNAPPGDRPVFLIDSTLDPSLRELVERILPLASYYAAINAFVESHSQFECGKVNHALGASLRTMMKDYLILVAQIEHQVHFAPDFGLQRVWYHLLPTLRLVEVLYCLILDIYEGEKPVIQNESFSRPVYQIPEKSIRNGGVILGIIANRLLSRSGDQLAKKVYTKLLQDAAVPYFEIMRTWINEGEIIDPFQEFMVYERKGLNKEMINQDFNDLYWEHRYTISAPNTPAFLKQFDQKVLLAGKYLNVIRECERNNSTGVITKAPMPGKATAAFGECIKAIEDGRFVAEIDAAYKFANHSLLELLFKQESLMERLRSIKHYFLLDQSDFLTHFLDLTYDELTKPRTNVALPSLISTLELIVRNPASASCSDPFKDSVTIELSPYSLVEQLVKVATIKANLDDAEKSKLMDATQLINISGMAPTEDLKGIDSLMLGYNGSFPISLVLNKRVITKYQLLFRHLLRCKHLERLLCLSWMDTTKFTRPNTGTRKGKGKLTQSKISVSPNEDMAVHSRMGLLRGRMLHFFQQLMHFLFVEVIDPNWALLEKRLSELGTFDEVLKHHQDFLDTCLKDCMLTNTNLLSIFGKLADNCIDFVKFADSYSRSKGRKLSMFNPASDSFYLPHQSNMNSLTDLAEEAAPTNWRETMKELDRTQIALTRSFINALLFSDAAESAPRIQDLVTRLDYNDFYSKMPLSGVSAAEFQKLEAQMKNM